MVLALGRAGDPRKLGVKGEELPKVMYRLIEADHYINKKILVVGGGDSAVEAAMGLANQTGNQVTLSYRSERFSRIKERNAKRIEECMRNGKVKVLFKSNPVEFKAESVVLDVNGSRQEIAERFCLDLCGRHSSQRFPEEDRRRLRNARHDAGSQPGSRSRLTRSRNSWSRSRRPTEGSTPDRC